MRTANLVITLAISVAAFHVSPAFAQTNPFAETNPFAQVTPGKIYVTSNTQLKLGSQTVATVTAGNILKVEDTRPGWFQVHHKGSIRGWIPQRDTVPVEIALNRFNADIATRPTAFAYVGRALIFKDRNDLALALRDLDSALRLEPGNVFALHTRGVVWMKDKQWSRSIRDFDDVLRLTTDPVVQASALRNRGIARMRNNEFEKAVSDFDANVQIDPVNSADAIAHRGEARNFLKSDPDTALADLDEALRLNPRHERAWSMRAANYELRGDWEHALADYNQALALNSENTVALDNRGVVWEQKGDLDKALADFSAAIQIDPRFAAPFHHRARAYERQGSFEKAEADLNEFVTLSEGQEVVLALVTRAGFFARRESVVKAQADIDEALRMVDHTQAEPLREIAWFLATCPIGGLRQGALALKLAQESCELTSFSKPAMLDALAAAYAETGEFDKAIETDAKAMALSGNAKQRETIQVRLEYYAHNKPYRDEL